MASLHSKVSFDYDQNTITTSMTREDLMVLAQNEYARQLCKFTEAQLKKKVPCYTEKRKMGMDTISALKAIQQQQS
ncbi:uncharacterized protein B0P05DRAFT_525138 [Gilbertella persicaria]|uniref:Uncharacterized protein n=1 Tax=Rhizopus stolonifer TaxID=4846 RepID=A0A367IZ40_RHIST|nr:uncharacterized protein B0P05DRAFT_525138 [Gilbertella persicaria]KAI8092185.1 hypothetical protein B0P05DRAFT_525138 [Gilbertella persicaria]RCH82940.1 hypothetical protein CU098_008522 [Rhizopus stolonifer]